MTKVTQIVQVPARKVGAILPSTLAVGDAVLELHTRRTPNGGSHSKSFIADWTKKGADGQAHVELRPLSKVATEISVSVAGPKNIRSLLWPRPARKRLAELFAQAIAYEVETRNIEEGSAFGTRRTSAELVRARSA
jgi:hypothetical protein